MLLCNNKNQFCIFFSSFYFSSALVKHQAVVSKEDLQDRGRTKKDEPTVIQLQEYLKHSGSLTSKKIAD